MLSLILGMIFSSEFHIHQDVPIDDHQLYYESCLTVTQKFLTARYPQANPSAVNEVVKKDCDEIMTYIEQNHDWDLVKNPAEAGCWDSVALNLKGQSRAEIALNQKAFCGFSENVSSRE